MTPVTPQDLGLPSPHQIGTSATPPGAGATVDWPWLLAVLGWAAFLSTFALSGGAGFEPIDAWVAQTAREMLDAGAWIVPQFAGETRLQKSPGPYWAVMVTSLLSGQPIDAATARIPNAIAAVVFCGVVYWLTCRIAGRRAAVFAGFAAASSVLVLWWSHRAASDFGLATWTLVSLACLFVALEQSPTGRPRVGLLLLGYFAAGMGMLWKFPMPLAVVGAPAAVYVAIGGRWRVLATRWHLAGLVVFALPWLPWVIAVLMHEPGAIDKWRVETIDRYTGDLPNVAEQGAAAAIGAYLAAPLLYCLPYSLSLPAAFSWLWRRRPEVDRRGLWFCAAWFVSLLVFLSVSAGKEQRYILPALPPLFVLLGVELSALFDPARVRPTWLTRLILLGVLLVLPATLFVGGCFALSTWWRQRGQFELAGLRDWSDVWPIAALGGAILVAGAVASAWCYHRGRRGAAFAVLVVMMAAFWMHFWPRGMPIFYSQRPFDEFAARLLDPQVVPPSQRRTLRMIGTHEPRLIWRSDLRFPRLLDQFELLAEQRGSRSIEYETNRYRDAMIAGLDGDEQVLYVMPLVVLLRGCIDGPKEFARIGRPPPPLHLWAQSRYGTPDQQYVLVSNRPAPRGDAELNLPPKLALGVSKQGGRLPPWGGAE